MSTYLPSALLLIAMFPLAALAAESGENAELAVPVEIKGNRVEFSGREGRAVFSGAVTVIRGSSRLTCDELETIRGSNEALARGNVVFRDSERSLDLVCDEAAYTHGLRHMTASGSCRLIAGRGEDLTVVKADEMEIFVDGREAIARGKVDITQGESRAECQRAHLFGEENKVVLTGRPVLSRPPHKFESDEVVSYFREGRSVLVGSVKGELHTTGLGELQKEGL